jgi:hypothetical protein
LRISKDPRNIDLSWKMIGYSSGRLSRDSLQRMSSLTSNRSFSTTWSSSPTSICHVIDFYQEFLPSNQYMQSPTLSLRRNGHLAAYPIIRSISGNWINLWSQSITKAWILYFYLYISSVFTLRLCWSNQLVRQQALVSS